MGLQQQFERDGFVVVPDAFDASQLESLQRAAAEIVDAFDIDAQRSVFRTDDRDTGRDDYFFDSATRAACFLEADALDADGKLLKPKAQSINKIGHGIHDENERVASFCRLPVIRQTLSNIGWDDCLVQQTMFIFKPPSIGGEVRWHQDGSYLIADAPGVIGIWIALERATQTNGCLWMQPGQHRSPLREQYRRNPKTGEATLETLDDTPWSEGDAVPIEVDAGAMVLFADTMPHYSAANTSNRSRLAFTIHVKQRRSHWSAENWIDRSGAAELALG